MVRNLRKRILQGALGRERRAKGSRGRKRESRLRRGGERERNAAVRNFSRSAGLRFYGGEKRDSRASRIVGLRAFFVRRERGGGAGRRIFGRGLSGRRRGGVFCGSRCGKQRARGRENDSSGTVYVADERISEREVGDRGGRQTVVRRGSAV